MSCGNPAVETDALMPRKRKHDRSAVCVKCKQNKGNILIRHSVYCKSCFLANLAGKFKRNLDPCVNPIANGPRKLSLKASGNLLVGYSGGLGSTVLLDLVASGYFSTDDGATFPGEKFKGKDHPRNVRAWNQGAVAYVEVCAAFPGTKDRTDEVRALVEEKYPGFEFISLRVEDAFDPEWWKKVGGTVDLEFGVDMSSEALLLSRNSTLNNSPINRLSAHLSALPTHTALPSTVQTLVRLLLLHTAHAKSCSHLLLGTSATRLAIGLLAGIAGGSGFVVGAEVEEEWAPSSPTVGDPSPRKTVRVNRPLRDAGTKECIAWTWWRHLHVLCGKPATESDFIMHLDQDYPSTVSTIARTCGKLAPAQMEQTQVQICVLCGRPAQSGVQDWKERISIRSFNVEVENRTNESSLTPHLCYACHTTLTSKSSRGATIQAHHSTAVSLPVWVDSQLYRNFPTLRKLEESEMKAEIGAYLLEL